jgi:hypothetical protein
MRQFKRTFENSQLNSVQSNIARSVSTSGQSVEELRESGRTTENNAAQFTRSFDKSASFEQTQSSSKLQSPQILNKRMQLSQQLAEANEKLVKDAIERENKYLAELERTVDQVGLQKPEFDSMSAKDNIESKKFIQDLIIQSLERITELEKIQLNLRKVLGDARMTQSQIQLDALNRSQPVRQWVFNP